MRWSTRTASEVPAGMVTSSGAGGAAGGGGCGTAETTGAEGDGLGVPTAGGALVVTRVGSFCPVAGGCTTGGVVIPSLSTETTCCGWPVATACFLACSRALSCFEAQPNMPAANTSDRAGTLPLRIHQDDWSIFCY